MAITLYDATVRNFQQSLAALSGVLDAGLKHCQENNIDPEDYVGARLCGDMLPLHFQVQSAGHHSLGAIRGVQAGKFAPPPNIGKLDYAGLQKLITDSRVELDTLTSGDVNALADRDLEFVLSEKIKMPFVGEDFLLTFSVPNFYFHCTTTYAILRHKGVPLGKRDFIGLPRMKRS